MGNEYKKIVLVGLGPDECLPRCFSGSDAEVCTLNFTSSAELEQRGIAHRSWASVYFDREGDLEKMNRHLDGIFESWGDRNRSNLILRSRMLYEFLEYWERIDSRVLSSIQDRREEKINWVLVGAETKDLFRYLRLEKKIRTEFKSGRRKRKWSNFSFRNFMPFLDRNGLRSGEPYRNFFEAKDPSILFCGFTAVSEVKQAMSFLLTEFSGRSFAFSIDGFTDPKALDYLCERRLPVVDFRSKKLGFLKQPIFQLSETQVVINLNRSESVLHYHCASQSLCRQPIFLIPQCDRLSRVQLAFSARLLQFLDRGQVVSMNSTESCFLESLGVSTGKIIHSSYLSSDSKRESSVVQARHGSGNWVYASQALGHDKSILEALCEIMRSYPTKKLIVKTHPTEESEGKKKLIFGRYRNVVLVDAGKIEDLLEDCELFFTHYSTSAFEAIRSGVPIIWIHDEGTYALTSRLQLEIGRSLIWGPEGLRREIDQLMSDESEGQKSVEKALRGYRRIFESEPEIRNSFLQPSHHLL